SSTARVLRSMAHDFVRFIVLCRRAPEALGACVREHTRARGVPVPGQFRHLRAISDSAPPGTAGATRPPLHPGPGSRAVWLCDLAVRRLATAISAVGVCRVVIP